VNGYEDHVLKHYAEPFHHGENPCGYTHRGAHRSDVCGDEVHIELHVSSWGIISRFYWTGEGCCFSQAAASMLAEHFEHQSLDFVAKFTEEDMFKLFAAEVPSARRGCVLTAFHALKHLETADAKA
jgi:nitrogen fixation NifU-like protein